MVSEPEGSEGDRVLLADPDEPIVTFFFKLPEPISIPEYTVFPEQLHASILPIGWLEKGTEMEGVPGRRDMTKIWVTGSSLIVHHVKVGLAASLGLDAVFKAALVGINGPDYRDSASMPDDLDADCTVVEVALPAWVNLTLEQARWSRNDVPSTDVRDGNGLSGEQIGTLFNVAIGKVRSLQMAYHVIENGPVTLLAEEVLPPLIPYVVRNSAQIEEKEAVELRLYEARRSFNAITRQRDLPGGRVEAIASASRQIDDNPLAAYLDLDREALVALRRYGNTRVSVTMAAASAEVVLDRTLLMLLWEERKTPEDVAANWRDSLKRRVEKDFSERIGGSWDHSGMGPVGRWARKVSNVRNRVVHGGYLPSRDEADDAIAVTRELVTFICDRLASEGNLNKYTRSAMLLMGNDGLEKRGRHTNAVKRLQGDPNEPPWTKTFGLWFKTFSRLRSDLLAPRVSSLEGSDLLAVYMPGEWPTYVACDTSTGQAVKVHIPDNVELGASRELVDQIFSEHSQGENRQNPISISISGSVVDGVQIAGGWVEEYRLLPLRGVMVDGSNFTVGDGAC